MLRFLGSLAIVALTVGASIARAQGVEDPPVKKSTQGICHERGKGSYSKTKHFESYETLEACIASGGRASANVAVGKPGIGESLAKYGGKLAFAIAVIAVAFGAYWLSARRRQTSNGAKLNELEQRKWEGHKLGRRDGGPKPPLG